MSDTVVTKKNIVEVAKQCRGQVRASDADGTHGAVFVQVDVPRWGHDHDTRAYLGDTVVTSGDTFGVVRKSALLVA